MRPAVRDGFVPVNAPWEGETTWMYLDVRGLVTCAMGNLVDPVSVAVGQPWKRSDGEPASPAEIVSEWTRIKARQDLKLRGGGAFRALATLHLTEEGVKHVVDVTLARMDLAMSRRFERWEEWPADAQMFALNMSWAVGPAWVAKFPRCAAALDEMDFLAAALECHIDETGNPGVKPRNRGNVILLRNASVVAGEGFDRARLWYPRDIWEHPLAPDTGPDTEDEITPVRAVAFPIVSRLPDTNPFDEPANDDGDDPEAA